MASSHIRDDASGKKTYFTFELLWCNYIYKLSLLWEILWWALWTHDTYIRNVTFWIYNIAIVCNCDKNKTYNHYHRFTQILLSCAIYVSFVNYATTLYLLCWHYSQHFCHPKLCSKLCWHNRLKPNKYTGVTIQAM